MQLMCPGGQVARAVIDPLRPEVYEPDQELLAGGEESVQVGDGMLVRSMGRYWSTAPLPEVP